MSQTWGKVIAVYHRSTNCSEVTELDETSGVRGSQRNGDAQLGTQLLSDGTYVTTTGPSLLDTWRYDMVQTMEYGTVPDFYNPNVQPRAHCTYGTVSVAFGLIGVIERCPGDAGDRLSVYRATATNADQPSVVTSNIIGGHNSRLIAMTAQYAAVVQDDPMRVSVFNDQTGALVAAYPLNLPESDLAGNPAGRVVSSWTDADGVYWYTGSSTIALSRDRLPSTVDSSGHARRGHALRGQVPAAGAQRHRGGQRAHRRQGRHHRGESKRLHRAGSDGDPRTDGL